MSFPDSDGVPCGQMERVALHALRALPPEETADIEAHLSTCPECRREMTALRPVVDAFASWPADVLRPSEALWERVAHRLADETGGRPMLARSEPYSEPAWESVAPGIACKMLATDSERHRISMLVRLEPGAEYPPHAHAGVEELHLLYGELWVDDRKLSPGDYRRAEAGTSDRRVWSATGCTCVLITSTQDALY
ncbi:MAG TPA: cupin domain-containing protein [Steroidobacteraceae bacterium]|nr:cupin domain-containing protein [Steroidobacteraceae bacterium]